MRAWNALRALIVLAPPDLLKIIHERGPYHDGQAHSWSCVAVEGSP